jgi:imidazolonepropionase-like amidohydrolase
MRSLAFRPLVLALLGLAATAQAGQRPGSFAVRAGTVISISGDDLSPGVVVVRDGRIESVGGADTLIPEGLEVIDAGDGVLMPGFIDAHSSRGLDFTYETAADASFIRVHDGINPVSLEIEDARRNGITTLLVAASNNAFIGGRAAIIHPQGIAVDSMIVEMDAALKISLAPRAGTSRMGHLAQLRRILDGSKRWLADRETARKREGRRASKDDIPPEKQALVDLLEGRLRTFIYCPTAADVSTAFSLGRTYGFHVTPILAPEAWRAAELVRTNNVRAVLTPRLDTWETQPDGTRLHVNLAKVLSDAGVSYSLTTDSRALGAQHPWYQAARAVRAGVPRAEALAAVTREPAVLLGFGNRKGVIAPGADADLLLLSGDPLSGSAFVDRSWVRGIEIYDRRDDVKLERLLQVGDEPPMTAPESDHGDPKLEAVERKISAIEHRKDPAAAEAAQRWPAGPGVTGEPESHAAPTPDWKAALEGDE